MGFLFLLVGIGVYFISSGNAQYIIEIIPYVTLAAALAFVAGSTFLDYKGKEIKKALYMGGIIGIICFFLLISMIEGIIFLLEKNISNQVFAVLLVAFSLSIVLSTILLWIAKSRFY